MIRGKKGEFQANLYIRDVYIAIALLEKFTRLKSIEEHTLLVSIRYLDRVILNGSHSTGRIQNTGALLHGPLLRESGVDRNTLPFIRGA